MAMKTVRQIESAKPEKKAYKLTVDRGLYLNVSTTGTKSWQIRYVIEGKQRQLSLPAHYGNGDGFMSLAQALAENARVQALARDGIDIQVQKAEIKEAKKAHQAAEVKKNLTVNDLYTAWLGYGVARKDGNAHIIRTFNKDVLPVIGNIPIRNLTEQHLRALYKSVTARGVQQTVIDLAKTVKQMFQWGERRQPWRGLLTEGNPADLIKFDELVNKGHSNIRKRVLSVDEIRELSNIFNATQTNQEQAKNKYTVNRPVATHTQNAIWLCLSTMCRIGELLLTEWKHIDFIKREWRIPAENTKGSRKKDKNDHVIFLSDFALKQLSELKANAISEKWVFPSRNDPQNHIDLKTVSKQIGDRQFQFKNRSALPNRTNDNSLVLGDGKAGEWTPHDLRRTGATMMQAMGVKLDTIDRCLNHVLMGSSVRFHYMQYQYEPEVQEAWLRWGERIEQILAAENLIMLRRAKA